MHICNARVRFVVQLLLATCSTLFDQMSSAAGVRAVRSLLEIRQQNVVIQQFDLSCGAAALATLLRFQHGETITERDVATGLMRRDAYLADPDLIRQHQGFSLRDLKRFVQSRGYDGAGYGGMQLDDLNQQAPLMVPLSVHGYQHFVIFRGVVGNHAVLADPAWGNRTMPIDEFLQAWSDDPQIGRVGFVIKVRETSAANNLLAPRPDDFVLLK